MKKIGVNLRVFAPFIWLIMSSQKLNVMFISMMMPMVTLIVESIPLRCLVSASTE